MIKAVIFDLDDTLISEEDYVKSGYRHIAQILSNKVGLNNQSIFEMLMEIYRTSQKNVFNRLLCELQIPYIKNDIIELVEVYRNHVPDINFYDDVLPCLEQLKTKGIKRGIITDGYIPTQRNKLKVLNAHKYFDHIIITEEIGREYWKPHPKAFEIMRKMLKVEYNQMVYVGDNPEKDFYISSIYPIKTVRICREGLYNDRNYLEDIKENFRINKLVDLLDLFE